MSIGPRTESLIDELRALKFRLGLSAEKIRDLLNHSYLSRGVSLGAVRRWLQGVGSPNSECTIAFQKFLRENNKEKSSTKPSNKKYRK